MKNLKAKTLIHLSVLLLVSSCSMEKRLYTKGFHIDWHSNKASTPTLSSANTSIHTTQHQEKLDQSIPCQNDQAALINAGTEPTLASSNTDLSKITPSNSNIMDIELPNTLTIKYEQIPSPVINAEGESLVVQKTLMHQNKRLLKKLYRSTSDEKILWLVLAFLIPPLAVFLYEGRWTNMVTLNLILTLCFFLPGVVHALIVLLQNGL